MKKYSTNLIGLGLLLIGLALGLAACGGTDPTSTPPAKTTPINPIIATITAGASGSPKSQPTTPSPAASLAAPVGSLSGVPLYTSLNPINLGIYGNQIAIQFSQTSPNAKTAFYYTGDGFDKLGAFYNTEMSKQGYTKTGDITLPPSSLIDGKMQLYTKDTANLLVVGIGPLDADLISTLSQASPSASALKPGNTLVILITGLSPTNVTDLQKTLGSS